MKDSGSAKIVVILLALAVVLGGTIVYSTMSKKDIVSSVQPITEGDLARIGFTASPSGPIRTALSFRDVTGDGVFDGVVEASEQGGSNSSHFFNAFTRDEGVRDLGCDSTQFYWGKATDEQVRAALRGARDACSELGIKLLDSGVQLPSGSVDQLRWSKEEGKFIQAVLRQDESSASKGWQTYSNSGIGVSFSYPPDFEVTLDEEKTRYSTGKVWQRIELKSSEDQGPFLRFEMNPDGYDFPTEWEFWVVSVGPDGKVHIDSRQLQSRSSGGFAVSDRPFIRVQTREGSSPSYWWHFYYNEGKPDYKKVFEEILGAFRVGVSAD